MTTERTLSEGAEPAGTDPATGRELWTKDGWKFHFLNGVPIYHPPAGFVNGGAKPGDRTTTPCGRYTFIFAGEARSIRKALMLGDKIPEGGLHISREKGMLHVWKLAGNPAGSGEDAGKDSV